MAAAAADDTCSYRTRSIAYFGSPRWVLMQSANGPCPLLAACNVLLLRNQLHLPHGELVQFEDLIQVLTNVLLDANSAAAASEDAGRAENMQENIESCIEVLPRLNVGLDVNCRFTGPRDFEATRELCVFDLLDISVVHGWVASREDSATYAAIGPHSYNGLVERLVRFEEALASTNLAEQDAALLRDGPLIRDFLDRSASQLTYEGLIRLHAELREHELAVLYRNNHFSTLLKHESSLYLLCTDVGFLGGAAVWERLDAVDGDTAYLDAEFRPLERGAPRGGPHPPLDADDRQEQSSTEALGAITMRAMCPACDTTNEFKAAGAQTHVQCGACGTPFTVAAPGCMPGQPGQAQAPPAPAPQPRPPPSAPPTPMTTIACRKCGAINQCPTPPKGQPWPAVKCHRCGDLNKPGGNKGESCACS